MFALKDADFADIIGQYLANLANTGLALSGDQVFPWVLEYYAKDDEKEIAEKEQEEKKKIQKDLKCRGFQFQEYGINETEKANCRQNGFHCAENPLDCLCYYPNWKNSVYYIVDASGDLDEDGEDSKISCTKMRLLKKIELRSLLLHGAAYMSKYPNRKWNSHVAKESGTSCNGFCIVRGKAPKAKGQKGDLLLLLKEQPGNSQILEIGVICIDGQNYPEEAWIDVTGKLVDL